MTDNQRIFADEYLIDRNGARAYKAAYPRVKSTAVASAAATRLLNKVNIKGYIDARLEEMSATKVAQAQEVMEYLTAVVRGETESEVVVVEGCGEGISSARRMSKSPDEKERLKAAELLGKRWGLFTDKLHLTGAAKVVIVDDIDES